MSKAIVKGLEFLSTLGFAVAYWKYDMHTALLVLMIFSTLSLLAALVLKEVVTKAQWLMWAVVMVFGGLSLFQDESIIKWKITILNSVLGLVFLGSHWIGSRKTILERVLSDKVKAPEALLKKINFQAVIYFWSTAIINYYVATAFSMDVWVKFKFFGMMAINLSFMSLAIYQLRSYLNFEER